ncbi:hypothetical protein [Paenibacillus sp. LPE1-1-1.1]|uniref:hypothetical protein n=1 Tax=Paenibacillus sp. LPE1-1-1.1 TaxID=3135230 RepID=UPI0034459F17
MAANKKITSDDLAKISVSLSLVGYGIGMLALERADKDSEDNRDKKQMMKAVNHLFKRFKG